MPDRRRQRQQRVRQEAGGSSGDTRSVGASNRDPVKEEPPQNNASRPHRHGGTGIAYAEPKEYESVTIMADKEVQEPQKYQRREILSNWLRYEDLPPEDPDDGEDYLIGEDFSTILEQQVSSGGHLMLKGENLLDDNETGILKSHGLGALHVTDLVAAINTIPLQTQLNIPEACLPDSVIEFYSNLADDNKKVYQPSNNYNDCLDVNEKILQSLKISDNEPLNLATDVETMENINKNAVDVALSLTSAFEPEPEDVDLDDLVREPTPEKTPEDLRQPSPLKEPSPVKEPSPFKEPSPVKEPTPVKETVSVKQPSPDKQLKTLKGPSPPKQIVAEKQPSPAAAVKGVTNQTKKQREKSKEKSPAPLNFGLPKTSTSNLPMNFGLPKVDTSSVLQTNSIVANALKDVDLGNSKVEEKLPEEPTIDLDAPVTQAKPVLLISKTEKDDLEDWLDSVLDD